MGKAKTPVTLILALVMAFSTLTPSYSAVKAGSTCTKSGQVKKSGSSSFKCTKSKSKLVWVKVTKSTSVQAQSNNSSSDKTPNTANPSASPSPSVTPKSLSRRQKALAEVKRFYDSNSNYNLPVNYILASDAPKDFNAMLRQTITVSARFWSDIFQPKEEFPIFLGTPKSVEWVNEQMKKYGHSLDSWTRNKIIEQGTRSGRGDVRNNDRGTITFYVIGEETEKSVNSGNILMMRGFVAHEYTHAVAVSILGSRGEGIPGWSVEGSANFYGHALAALMSPDPASAMETVAVQNLRRAYFESGSLIPHSLNKDDLHKAIVTSEKGGGGDGTTCAEPKILCYTAGELITEILVADYGHEKFITWWRLSKKKNWEVAFEEVFGFQIDKWYEEVAVPYIIKESRAAIPEVSAPQSSTSVTQFPPRAPRPFIEPGYLAPEALKAANDYLAMSKSASKKARITSEFGPNVDSAVQIDFENIVVKTINHFTNYLPSETTFLLLAGGDRDTDWLFNKITQVDQNFSEQDKNSYRNQLDRNKLLDRTRSSTNLQRIDFLATPNRLVTYSGDYRKMQFAKMAAQLVQNSISGNNSNVLPCWARTGQVKFLGVASNRATEANDFVESRTNNIGSWYQSRSKYNFQDFTAAEWINFLPKIDGNGNQSCENDDFSESAGWLLSEKQIADFGLNKVIEWWAKSKENQNWRDNFKTVFGTDVDVWYRNNAIPYLIDQLDRWIKPFWWND